MRTNKFEWVILSIILVEIIALMYINTLTDRNDFIENKTAADTKGVDFIRYMAETGEIFIRADENKSALMYNGKYWDGKIWADTMFTISVFTDIEKIYYRDEDRIEYDIKYMK